MKVACDLCGKPVETSSLGTYRYVEGWEAQRSQGGTNAIRLRKSHDRFAHKTCIDLAAKGRLGQESLI
jgi:hypothetical protein